MLRQEQITRVGATSSACRTLITRTNMRQPPPPPPPTGNSPASPAGRLSLIHHLADPMPPEGATQRVRLQWRGTASVIVRPRHIAFIGEAHICRCANHAPNPSVIGTSGASTQMTMRGPSKWIRCVAPTTMLTLKSEDTVDTGDTVGEWHPREQHR